MSNATYNGQWAGAMAELAEQVHLEDPTLEAEEGAPEPEPVRPTSIAQAFQHFACLYIKYLQIFRKLERCYDGMVHPQKRLAVLKVLELVMQRVVELKHSLVKYSPPPPVVQQDKSFPWEYVNLDSVLVDLKLPPETLEVPVPKYFREDSAEARKVRDKIVEGYMQVKHGVTEIPLESSDGQDASGSIPLDKAIEIIQLNERGRQGKERATLVKVLREEEKRRKAYDAAHGGAELDQDVASIEIQRALRGLVARNRAARLRERELVFLGMRPSITENVDREAQLKNAYIMRKQEQKDNKDAYERALEDMKEVVYNDEGPDMKRELEGERTEWLADAILEEDTTGIKPADLAAEGKVQRERGGKKKAGERGLLPESMQEFYDDKYPEPVEEEPEADPKADKGAKKDDKGKGKGKKDEPEEEELPLLQEKRDLTTKMFQTTEHYQNEWEDFNEEDNFAQKHDVELVKNEIRDGVKLQIRDEVDEMFRDQLKKLKQELGQNFAKPPKAKKIKPSKKNAKGEKIKFKKLTGDKNKEIAGLSVEETLVKLVDHGLVNSYKPRKISDLIGDFNYLGTVRQSCEPAQGEEWQPADPSMQQLRAAITEYCVLPLGSQRVATAMRGDQHGDVPDSSYEPVRSILLYGPKGSGKTAMVEAIAHELGALLINISPAKVKGKFGENKKAPATLPHLICKVATDPAFSPVIVYMDDAHEYMVGKKFDKTGPGRFCKEFQNYKKSFFTRRKNGGTFTASVKKGPQPCPPDDKNCPNGTFDARILFIGCTSEPEKADPKATKAFFDRMLYFPYPDHASRYMLWKQTIAEQLKGSPVTSVGDLSTLAHVSEGFSAGAIISCVKKTLTKRRVERLGKRPFESSEFLNPLARAAAEKQLSYQDDHKAFLKFTSEVASTLATEKKNLEIIKAGGDPNAKKKGKKK